MHASGAREVRTGPGDGDGDGDGNADNGSGRATYSEWESMKPGRHHPTSDQWPATSEESGVALPRVCRRAAARCTPHALPQPMATSDLGVRFFFGT